MDGAERATFDPLQPIAPRWPRQARLLTERAPEDGRYAVVALRRLQVPGGGLACVGDLVFHPELREVLHLVRTGCGRPADRRTLLDVELGLELQRAIPRPPQ